MKISTRFNRRKFLKQGAACALGALATSVGYQELSAQRQPPSRTRPNESLGRIRESKEILHRIIAVGDPHWGDDHITTSHPRLGRWANNIHYKERHKMLLDWLNKEKASDKGLDLIVLNGDLVTNRAKDLDVVKEYYTGLKADYLVVHGNHDHSSEKNWKRVWGYGRNHSVDLGNYAIVLANSAAESGSYECLDHKWLAREFRKYNAKKGIFLFCHIFQHGHTIDCPEATEVMASCKNLKMITYSHSHRLIGQVLIPGVKAGVTLNTFFTGHFSSWGAPFLGYRVIEVFSDNTVSTYLYDPKADIVWNYNLLGT